MTKGSIVPRQLSELLEDLTSIEHNGFYRKFYGLAPSVKALGVWSLEAWRTLKFLTKRDLVETPLRERIYCRFEDIEEGIDATSGTTGGPPLFFPRVCLSGYEFRSAVHDFSRPIFTSPPTHPARGMAMARALGSGGGVVMLDPHHIAASVAFAKAAGSRSIIVPAHIAQEVAEYIREEGFADRITSVELNGSGASDALLSTLLVLLPNATLTSNYGATEAEGPPIAISNPTRDVAEAKILHANTGFFLELIDTETLAPIEPCVGAEGELVLTRYVPRPFAFPLVRYRTGDVARVVANERNAPFNWLFSICGRRDFDFIKVAGGVLRSDEIERALCEEFGETVKSFEAECTGTNEKTVSKTRLTVYIKLSQTAPVSQRANMLAEKIHVSPSLTYADGVRKGMYDPLICKELDEAPEVKKPRRLRKVPRD